MVVEGRHEVLERTDASLLRFKGMGGMVFTSITIVFMIKMVKLMVNYSFTSVLLTFEPGNSDGKNECFLEGGL